MNPSPESLQLIDTQRASNSVDARRLRRPSLQDDDDEVFDDEDFDENEEEEEDEDLEDEDEDEEETWQVLSIA